MTNGGVIKQGVLIYSHPNLSKGKGGPSHYADFVNG